MAKHRINVPESHTAIILPGQLYEELLALMGLIRKTKSRLPVDEAIKRVAGDVILAAMDTVPEVLLRGAFEENRS
jgi:hypothetical protein